MEPSDQHIDPSQANKDLEKAKSGLKKLLSHPHLQEPCFQLGLEQKEQLKTSEVWQAFMIQEKQEAAKKDPENAELDD